MGSIIKDGITYPAISTFNVENLSSPFIMSIPHSGEIYPDDFQPSNALSYEQYDRPADRYIHELMNAFHDLDIATIKAEFPRSYVDVNRQQYDLDTDLLENPSEWKYKTSVVTNTTMIWRHIYGTDTYDRKLTTQEVRNRIANCYMPYHQRLSAVLETARKQYGVAYLLDCHSMAQYDINGTGKERPEIDLGNRLGMSCADDITNYLKELFEDLGYYVGINEKFAGGELTQRYGWPEINQHALQIEFRRDLYMNEDSRQRNEKFSKLQQDCQNVLPKFHKYLKQRKI